MTRTITSPTRRRHVFQTLFYLFVCLAFVLAFAQGAVGADRNASLWQAVKSGGHLVFIRHALAPGTGDPADFTIGDCSTQRNLDAEGRRQASRIGEMFRAHGIMDADIYSSDWCRCVDTARLMNLGAVKERRFLNSLHGRSENEAGQKAAFDAWLAKQDLERPAILVTHQATISAFLGVYPASGEMVVVKVDGGKDMSVIGRIPTD